MSEVRSLAPLIDVAIGTRHRAVPLRVWQQRYATWVKLSDAVTVVASVFASQFVRFSGAGNDSAISYTVVSVLIVASWLSAMAIFRTRAQSVLGVGTEEYRRVWTATMTTFLGISIVSSVSGVEFARGYLAIALVLGLVTLTLNRHVARRMVTAQRRRGSFLNEVLAVGQPESVDRFAQSLKRHPDYGFTLAGSCSPALVRERFLATGTDAITPYASETTFARVVRQSGADTVAIVSGDLTPDELRDLSWELERLDVELVVCPGVVDIAEPRLTFRASGGLPLIHVDKPQYHGAKRFEKRAFDVCFSALALLASLPLLVGAMIAIKLTSPGPVLYRSERIGRDGKPFLMIKFRTMEVGADQRVAELAHLNEGKGLLFKIREDPRVTRCGRFLRRYSIDELPQFVNVLYGDMSVVGPRPPLSTEVDSYDDNVRRRLLVRPGVTGLWQVSGRTNLSWEDSVRLDLSYVENWSMVADLAIIASTLRAVLTSDGAY